MLIHADKASQKKRLAKRGLSSEQIKRRLESQFSFKEKESKLKEAIKKDNQGKIWVVDNSDGASSDNITSVFKDIVEYFKIFQ